MFYGTPTLCLKTADLDAARAFYEAIGMRVIGGRPGHCVYMANGHFRLSLMTFLGDNCLNLRGADVFAVHDAVARAGVETEGEPERYRRDKYDADADGECWLTKDPDENVVFFDTNQNEVSADYEAERLKQLLAATEQELVAIGASDDCIATFRREMIERYAG